MGIGELSRGGGYVYIEPASQVTLHILYNSFDGEQIVAAFEFHDARMLQQ